MRGLALALMLAACGSHTTPDGLPILTSCGKGSCKAGDQCAYAGGTCSCGVPSYCGGIEPPEGYYDQPPSWQCSPTTPVVRADGCPGVQPSGACSDEGKSCGYGDCCIAQVVCTSGQWKAGPAECPP